MRQNYSVVLQAHVSAKQNLVSHQILLGWHDGAGSHIFKGEV